MKYLSKHKERLLLLLLFCVSFSFNLYYIQIHSFLHDWDERFHALVAKHLSENLLLPLLIKNSPTPVCDFSWVCNSVWLHKQPLFLWQMALSIKAFGVNEFAVRFPSALMLSLLVFPIFRIGKILFNYQTGFIAALLTISNWFILEHIDGFMGMDHNDVAFMFYVTLSIWAFVEYTQKSAKKYVFLIGFFASCAMLNKWVVGLLVFEGFFIYFLIERRKQIGIDFIISLLVAFAVFLPWQIYIYTHFKEIALHEWSFNQRHFWEVVEGHSHELDFYFNELKYQFSYLQILFMIGMGFALLKFNKRKLVWPLICMLFSVYIFFTIAATKIISYTMVTMPLLFLFSAYCITSIIDFFSRFKSKIKWIYFIFLPLLVFQNLDYIKLDLHYNSNGNEWYHGRNLKKEQNTEIYKKIANFQLPKKTAIIGFESADDIENMFYNEFPSYGFYTPESYIETLISKGYQIAVFRNHIPTTLINKKDLIILPFDYAY